MVNGPEKPRVDKGKQNRILLLVVGGVLAASVLWSMVSHGQGTGDTQQPKVLAVVPPMPVIAKAAPLPTAKTQAVVHEQPLKTEMNISTAVKACAAPLKKIFHTTVNETNATTDFDKTGMYGRTFVWRTSQFTCTQDEFGKAVVVVPAKAQPLLGIATLPKALVPASVAAAPPPAQALPAKTSAPDTSLPVDPAPANSAPVDDSAFQAPVEFQSGDPVTYQVQSSCPTDVTYTGDGGSTEQESAVADGWTKDVVPGDMAYISAQVHCEGGDVTVSVLENGSVIKEATSSGDYVIATASAP